MNGKNSAACQKAKILFIERYLERPYNDDLSDSSQCQQFIDKYYEAALEKKSLEDRCYIMFG